MSYTNVYPSRINWENEPSIASPINATNLNKMDYALYQMDQTLETWDVTKANQSDLLLSVKSIDYDTSTGVFVFTWQNGTTKTVDLNIEKIPVSFSMSPQGVITMTTSDGTTYTADVGALIKTYTFTDSSEIDFTVTTDSSGNKTVTASIVAGSITGSKLEPNYLANCQSAANSASGSATAADGSAEDSEAWAVGTRDGVPVPSTDPAYQNNSKYWATQGGANSLAGLSDTDINSPTDGQGLVYDYATSKWKNGNVSSGSTITVFTNESSLYGRTVTLTIGQQTKTETFSNVGVAVFKGIVSTGTFTITSTTSGGDTATTTLNVPYFGNYTKQLTLFSATVTVTFPYSLGATCTLSDGTTTLSANTSPMAFDVPNSGTWTATVTLDGQTKTDSVTITTDGQTESMSFSYGTINLTYDNEFRGMSISCASGGTTITKTAPISGNSMAFYPPSTGTWTISSTYSGVSYSTSVTVSSLSTAVTAQLQMLPDGSTVTPTDDIQIWLNCAGIYDKNYTTLSEVLADTTTFDALLRDSNACNYMARSTTWAVAEGLVPEMTSATTPSGTVISSGDYSVTYAAWKAFDRNDSTNWASTSPAVANTTYVGYKFTSAVKIQCLKIKQNATNYFKKYKVQGSNDGFSSDVHDLTDTITETSAGNTSVILIPYTANYSDYRLLCVEPSVANDNVAIYTIQFYTDADITTDADAMTRIGKYDYCADKLSSNSTWAQAIGNSAYMESVWNVCVPKMTSNTAPSGVASASYVENTRYAYHAFDGSTSTAWSSYGGSLPAYVQYTFTSAVKVYKATIMSNNQSTFYLKDFTIYGSNDSGSTKNTLETVSGHSSTGGSDSYTFTNNNSYTTYGVNVTASNKDNCGFIQELQFYGRKSAQTDIVHTAPYADVYYMNGGTQTVLCTADGNGIGSVDWSDLDAGTYTLYSTVAKNPSDLTADYSKSVKITNTAIGGTTEVWLMPDGALYWYGCKVNIESCNPTNGWTSAYTSNEPTWNTNYATINGVQNKYSAIGNATAISPTKVHVIMESTRWYGNDYGLRVGENTSKNAGFGQIISQNNINNLEYYSANTTAPYLYVYGQDYRTGNVYAFWYE